MFVVLVFCVCLWVCFYCIIINIYFWRGTVFKLCVVSKLGGGRCCNCVGVVLELFGEGSFKNVLHTFLCVLKTVGPFKNYAAGRFVISGVVSYFY